MDNSIKSEAAKKKNIVNLKCFIKEKQEINNIKISYSITKNFKKQ
jgi:hypothetical protein